MLLEVLSANYIKDYKLQVIFNNGYESTVDLEQVLSREKRKIFQPLRDKDYFKNFSIRFNTVCWENEADFAPEFLFELGQPQEIKKND